MSAATELIDRRAFGCAALALSIAGCNSNAAEADTQLSPAQLDELQGAREAVDAFARSYVAAKDNLIAAAMAEHFGASGVEIIDEVITTRCPPVRSRADVQALYSLFFSRFPEPGRFAQFVHATGDIRHGIFIELVNVQGSFFGTGFDCMTIVELEDGRIKLYNDYWDSWQLTLSDLVGPALTSTAFDPFAITPPKKAVPVAFSLAPVHPNGTPRLRTDACSTSAGPERMTSEFRRFVDDFVAALRSTNAQRIADFLAEDCTLVHPLLATAVPGYGVTNRGIQITGGLRIAQALASGTGVLPEIDVAVERVIGSMRGGGYRWRAAGPYASTGLDRRGLKGATSMDMRLGKIARLSTKFDTFYVPATARAQALSTLRG